MSGLETPEPALRPSNSPLAHPREILHALWRWRLLFTVIAVAVPVAAFALRTPGPRQYRATAVVEVQQVQLSSGAFTPTLVPSPAINTAALLVQTTAIAQDAARRLRSGAGETAATTTPASLATSVPALLHQLTVTPDPAGFVTIAAVDPNPARAIAVANAFAAAFQSSEASSAVVPVERTITQTVNDLNGISTNDAAGRLQVRQQLEQLRALAAAEQASVRIIQPAASAPAVASTAARTTALSVVVGIMLAFAAVIAAQGIDRRIRTPEEYEELVDEPLLSVLPTKAFTGSGFDSEPAHMAADMLRARLFYGTDARGLTSIIVASAREQEGKTTVAAQLALSAARAGKRVILLDADLRHPQVCVRLGLEAGGGLSALLLGHQSIAQVMRTYTSPLGIGEPLSVLPAGDLPPNPSELLASERMQTLLRELEAEADLLIVDTPAALAVSDSLPLFRAASGVVLVARIGRTTRDGALRLPGVVTAAGGNLRGVVVTGGSAGMGYGYGYATYRAGADKQGRGDRSPQPPPATSTPRSAVPTRPSAPTAPTPTPDEIGPPALATPAGSAGAPPAVLATAPKPQMPADSAPVSRTERRSVQPSRPNTPEPEEDDDWGYPVAIPLAPPTARAPRLDVWPKPAAPAEGSRNSEIETESAPAPDALSDGVQPAFPGTPPRRANR